MKSLCVLGFLLVASVTFGAEGVRDLDTLRTFPKLRDRQQWERRVDDIRQHVLVSCGLWPMPEKTPLNAHVFGRLDRDGYSIEKVYFETYPGYILAGNLYRPLGKGKGPFPAVLNPHGHWNEGRLVDNETGSIAARCISFARQGMIAFSYDMVGYNDSREFGNHRAFALNPTNQLWNISLMGLQAWNSIRALDFLETLEDVDRSRLACTGESGGGTQTFILGAIDDRLALQAPIVMVSHSMQGGCLCENAPGLRVDYSNMEIAAVPAPRPQILVGATGDWTKMTMTVEGPALESVYRLFHSQDHLRYKIFNYNHNYNQTSREAVYAWFDRILLHEPDAESRKEAPYNIEAAKDLLVFPEGKLPEGALKADELIAAMVSADLQQIDAIKPSDAKSLVHWKRVMMPAWRHNFQLQGTARASREVSDTVPLVGKSGLEFPVRFLNRKQDARAVVVLVSDKQSDASATEEKELARSLGGKGYMLATYDPYLCGARADETLQRERKQFDNFFTTYNRTDLQERLGELQSIARYLRANYPAAKIVFLGEGKAGAWVMAGAPLADAVIADADQTNDQRDEAYLKRDLFSPGWHRMGDLQGVLALAAPNPILLHNTGAKLRLDWITPLYEGIGAANLARIETGKLGPAEITQWLEKI